MQKLSEQLEQQYKQNTELILRLEGIYALLCRAIDQSPRPRP